MALRVASRGYPSRQLTLNAAIVDTDVVSMLFKGDTRALAFRPHIAGRLLGISFMTLAELDWGPRRKLELAHHLTRYAFLPITRELCGKRAEVSFLANRKGRPIQTADPGLRRLPSSIRCRSLPTTRPDYSAVDGLVLLLA